VGVIDLDFGASTLVVKIGFSFARMAEGKPRKEKLVREQMLPFKTIETHRHKILR
jgi:hypothetical protein